MLTRPLPTRRAIIIPRAADDADEAAPAEEVARVVVVVMTARGASAVFVVRAIIGFLIENV